MASTKLGVARFLVEEVQQLWPAAEKQGHHVPEAELLIPSKFSEFYKEIRREGPTF